MLKSLSIKTKIVAVALISIALIIFLVIISNIISKPTVHTMAGLFPLSGPLADHGKAIAEAAKLAEKDVNEWLESENKKWRLQLFVADTKDGSTMIKATSLVQKYHESGTEFFIGPIAKQMDLDSLAYVNDHQLFMASPSAMSGELPGSDDNFFLFGAHPSNETAAIISAAAETNVKYLILGGCSGAQNDRLRQEAALIAQKLGIQVLEDKLVYDCSGANYSEEAAILADYILQLVQQDLAPQNIGVFIFDNSLEKLMYQASEYEILEEINWYGISSSSLEESINKNPYLSAFAANINLLKFTERVGHLGDKSNNSHVTANIGTAASRDVYIIHYITYDLVWALALAIDEVGYDVQGVKKVLPAVAEKWTYDYGAGGHIVLNEQGNRLFSDYNLHYYSHEDEWIYAGHYIGEKETIEWVSEEKIKLAPPQLAVPSDYPTIQRAIDAAGDGYEIIVAPGTYFENIDFKGKAILLQSKNPARKEIVEATIIDGGENGPVVSFQSGESNKSILDGFTITGGSGLIKDYNIITYEDEELAFSRNYGGGILVSNSSSPTIINNRIVNNTANDLNADTLGVGAGIAVLDGSAPIIENNLITENRAGTFGGGIAVWYQSSPTIKNSTIVDNRAGQFGGGMLIAMMCEPVVFNNIMEANYAENGGGVYMAHMSPAKITDNHFEANQAEEGAAIFIRKTKNGSIDNNTFIKNEARQDGAGIYADMSFDVDIDNNIFISNSAVGKGGAVFVDLDSTINIQENNSYEDNQPDNIYDLLFADPTLKHLGMTLQDIIDLYGEQYEEVQLGIGGTGYALHYRSLNLIFAFNQYSYTDPETNRDDVAINLVIYGDTEILGVKVGMTFDRILELLNNRGRIGFDESGYLSSHGGSDHYLICNFKGVEIWFFANERHDPTNRAHVLWKSYWDR